MILYPHLHRQVRVILMSYNQAMKERFENYLRAGTASERKEDTEESVALIERVVDEDTRSLIKELQAKKIDFVDGLRTWRKKFWNESPEEKKLGELQHEARVFEQQKGSRLLSYGADGTFATYFKGGEGVALSKGEVLAAAEWGFWWRFDDSVPPDIQKEVMSHQVRHVIAQQYDRQLVQMGKVNTLANDQKRDTYTQIEKTNLELETMPSGILAEKMLMSFLTKQMHDTDLAFKVISADVYEDVEHKIDFIIEVEDTRRGVKVNEPEHRSRIGIQFTMNPKATEQKERQLKRVRNTAMSASDLDEMVLITMPLGDIKAVFDAWRYTEEGNRRNYNRLDPRGPDHSWSQETKQQILDGLVRGISKPSEQQAQAA